MNFSTDDLFHELYLGEVHEITLDGFTNNNCEYTLMVWSDVNEDNALLEDSWFSILQPTFEEIATADPYGRIVS